MEALSLSLSLSFPENESKNIEARSDEKFRQCLCKQLFIEFTVIACTLDDETKNRNRLM